MLTATLAEEGFIDKSYIVPLWHPRKSLIREEAYLPPNRVWIVPKTSTHELEKISELNERGEEVIGIDVAEEFQGVSSTDIKSKMCSGDDWSQCVPTSAADYIRTHHGIEKITSLIESNKDAFNEYRKAKSQNR
jgi:nicotinamide mononucleotide adenylyltransferase